MRKKLRTTFAVSIAAIFMTLQTNQAQTIITRGSLSPMTSIGSAMQVGTRKLNQKELDSMRREMIDKFSTIYTGVVLDSATKEPIQSAVVYLMGASDMTKDLITKSTVTDKKGRFEILVSGDSKLEISCLGYKIYTRRVNTPKHQNGFIAHYSSTGMRISNKPQGDLGKIFLAPDPFSADEVVVKSRLQMFEQRGDTTRIFPKLSRTMEGDALIEVLRQIPGFKVEDDGTIYENGRKIERTYVNNTLLFGTDPRTAFLKLSAQSALAIDTYEEKVDDQEGMLTNRDKQDKTRRVANVTTTRKIKEYFIMTWTAEGGLDHDKDIDGSRNVRYGLDGDIGFYKVGNQLSANLKHSTMTTTPSFRGSQINYFKSGNPKETEFSVRKSSQIQDSVYTEYDKKNRLVTIGQFNSQYSYSSSENRNKSRSISSYFPSINFDSQIIENINESSSERHSHKANIDYSHYHNQFFMINVTPEYSTSKNGSLSMNSTTTDGKLLSKTNNVTDRESKRYGLNASASVNKPIISKLSRGFGKPTFLLTARLNSNIDYKENKGDGTRNYELTDVNGTNITKLTFESDSPTTDFNIFGGLNFSRNITFEEKRKDNMNKASRFSLDLKLEYRYNKNREYSIALNQATGQIDEAYSGDYVRNDRRAEVGLSIFKEWKSGISLQGQVTYADTKVKNDEKLPNESNLNNRFDNLIYSFSFQYNKFHLSFMKRDVIPYVNQLSNVLNHENPMSLSAGNPNLKSGSTYNMNMMVSNRSYTKPRKLTLSASYSINLNIDPVTMMRSYFKESTVLPEYGNYEVAAGATLNRPMNVGNHISTSGGFDIEYLWQKYVTTFRLHTNAAYSNPFASIDNEMIRNENKSANISFSILSTPTRKIRFSLNNRTTFSWQENDKYSDRSRTNQLSFDVRFDLLNRLTFTPSYSNTYQKAYTTGQTIERNALNLSLGARMLKKRNGLLSINVYNIFNDNSGYNLNSTDQFVSESWSQIFSRFYSISFQYKFNSLDHTKDK